MHAVEVMRTQTMLHHNMIGLPHTMAKDKNSREANIVYNPDGESMRVLFSSDLGLRG